MGAFDAVFLDESSVADAEVRSGAHAVDATSWTGWYAFEAVRVSGIGFVAGFALAHVVSYANAVDARRIAGGDVLAVAWKIEWCEAGIDLW